MELDPEDYNQYNYNNYDQNSLFAQSHTSFKSMMSGATVMTDGGKQLNKLVKQKIDKDTDLDEYLEKLLKQGNKYHKRGREEQEFQ